MFHLYLSEIFDKSVKEALSECKDTDLKEVLKTSVDYFIDNIYLYEEKEACDQIKEYIHKYEEINLDFYFTYEISKNLILNSEAINLIRKFYQYQMGFLLDHTQIFIGTENKALCEFLVKHFKGKLDFDELNDMVNDEDGIPETFTWKMALAQ